MKAVPVETINRIIRSMKNELAIELLKAIIENHAVDISDNKDQKFNDLVARIRSIDSNAADWIVNNENMIYKYADGFPLMFEWGITPQGYDYWHEIDVKLGELR